MELEVSLRCQCGPVRSQRPYKSQRLRRDRGGEWMGSEVVWEHDNHPGGACLEKEEEQGIPEYTSICDVLAEENKAQDGVAASQYRSQEWVELKKPVGQVPEQAGKTVNVRMQEKERCVIDTGPTQAGAPAHPKVQEDQQPHLLHWIMSMLFGFGVHLALSKLATCWNPHTFKFWLLLNWNHPGMLTTFISYRQW